MPHIKIAEPLRILVWSPYGACVKSGGSGLSASRLYSSDRSKKIRVTLAHGLRNHPEAPEFDDCIFISPLSRPSSTFNHIKFIVYSIFWLILNAKNFDIFHGIDTFEATVTPAVWAKRLGMKVIVKPASIRSGTASTKSWRKIFGRPARRLKSMKDFDKIISISSSISENLLNAGIPPENLAKIPNGVDVERFTTISKERRLAAREKIGIGVSPFIILCVCGIRPVKRIEWLIRSIAAIDCESSPTELHIVGPAADPKYAKSLSNLVAELSLQENVVFHPETVMPEEYYRAADIFCLVSSYEGLSNSLLEAMASALPVISTPVSGSLDLIINEENGFIIENQNDLEMRIKEVQSNRYLAQELGRKARKTVVNKYSQPLIWDKYLDVFTEARRVE